MRHEEILIRVNDELARLAEGKDLSTNASVAKIQVLLNALDDAIIERINWLLEEQRYVRKETRPTIEDEILEENDERN